MWDIEGSYQLKALTINQLGMTRIIKAAARSGQCTICLVCRFFAIPGCLKNPFHISLKLIVAEFRKGSLFSCHSLLLPKYVGSSHAHGWRCEGGTARPQQEACPNSGQSRLVPTSVPPGRTGSLQPSKAAWFPLRSFTSHAESKSAATQLSSSSLRAVTVHSGEGYWAKSCRIPWGRACVQDTIKPAPPLGRRCPLLML